MDLNLTLTVIMIAGLVTFVLSALACYARVTQRKLIVILASVFVFFAVWTGLDFVDSRSLRIVPVAIFLWLWVFVFYFFGLRYLSGRGLFQRVSHQDAIAAISAGKNPTGLAKALRVSWHVLLWPMIVLIVYVLVKGLTGRGWVITL